MSIRVVYCSPSVNARLSTSFYYEKFQTHKKVGKILHELTYSLQLPFYNTSSISIYPSSTHQLILYFYSLFLKKILLLPHHYQGSTQILLAYLNILL